MSLVRSDFPDSKIMIQSHACDEFNVPKSAEPSRTRLFGGDEAYVTPLTRSGWCIQCTCSLFHVRYSQRLWTIPAIAVKLALDFGLAHSLLAERMFVSGGAEGDEPEGAKNWGACVSLQRLAKSPEPGRQLVVKSVIREKLRVMSRCDNRQDAIMCRRFGLESVYGLRE